MPVHVGERRPHFTRTDRGTRLARFPPGTELDRAVLASYCQAYGRWVEAERRLKDTPMVIKLASGVIQQSPWLAIANKQVELMQRFAAELGLSPVSRTRVDARPAGQASTFAGLLGGGPPNADDSLSGRYKP